MQNVYDNDVFFEGYMKLREDENSANMLVEVPAMFSLLPDVKGKRVLDLGCGSGQYCLEFLKMGARKIVGVDISQKMLSVAKKKSIDVEYIRADINDLSFLDEQFDIVFSSMAFHYIKDFDKLCENIYKILSPDGCLQFSREHPIQLAPTGGNKWTKDEQGNKLAFHLSDYTVEGERKTNWFIEGIVKKHLTFSSIINTLIENGFIIEKILEPVPSEEDIERLPTFADTRHKPHFLIIKAKKTII